VARARAEILVLSYLCLRICDGLCSLLGLPLGLPRDLAGLAPLGLCVVQLGEALLLGLGEEELGSAVAARDCLARRLLVLASLAALGAALGKRLPVHLLEERLVLAREDEAVRAVRAREVHVGRERREGLLDGARRSRALGGLGSLHLLLDVRGLLSLKLLLQLHNLLLGSVHEAAELGRVLADRDATLEVGEIRLGLEETLVGDERHSGCVGGGRECGSKGRAASFNFSKKVFLDFGGFR